MAAISFPASPYTTQIYTVGSKSWQWDGAKWIAYYNEGPDGVFGNAYDGSQTLDGTTTITLGDSTTLVPATSVYSLARDVFFNDLTLSANVRLQPNGYRIFVQGTLKFNSGSTIGYTTGYSTAGSIQQGGAASTAVSPSLGGSATGFAATVPTAAQGGSVYYRTAENAINCYSLTGSSTSPVFLRGGAGGAAQAGGGIVVLSARYISGPSTGTAYVKAPGTAPAGGGVIFIISSNDTLPASISTDVTGQNAGTYYYIQRV